MAKVLSVSSQVVYGHVGNSATAFVLQRMGHDVLSVPSVLLSNRPGYPALAGERADPAKMDALLEAVFRNGWLSDVDAILTGYIPAPGHASFCKQWIERIKTLNPAALYLCDPISGDEPNGLYVSEAAAQAVKNELVPLADILTPNRFELGWLSGRPVTDAFSVIEAAKLFAPSAVLVTSAPADAEGHIANILVEGDEAFATINARETVYAHGTGDFFAATFLGRRLNGFDNKRALQAAASAMSEVLAASEGHTELDLIRTQAYWGGSDAPLVPIKPLLAP